MRLITEIPRIFIGATSGETGKTTISIGILAALRARGMRPSSFKKGPDFIDPMWLSAASGRPCRNLDQFLFPNDIYSQFEAGIEGSRLALIEGNHGLFDSIDAAGEGSSANLARLLGAPVILVVGAVKATRSLAPLIQGFANFEPGVHIAGIIFNRVAGKRHEIRIREVMTRYCNIPVLGYIHRTEESYIEQRYLGLTPEEESDKGKEIISRLGRMIEESIDLDRLVEIARQITPAVHAVSPADITGRDKAVKSGEENQKRCTIAVARDRAFNFYYRENLDALQRYGAELVEFSPLDDPCPPEADAVYFGGGFPELFARELSQNRSMLDAVRKAISEGMPVYAECGGMIYLSRSVEIHPGEVFPLTGALEADVKMSPKPHGRGYIVLHTRDTSHDIQSPWKIPADMEVRAHEFHYSAFTNPVNPDELIYQLERGEGISRKKDGWLKGSILASYAHLHSLAAPWWAGAFCDVAAGYRQKRAR